MWRRPGTCILVLLLSCENREERAWASLTVVDPQHHVGILARSLPEVLQC